MSAKYQDFKSSGSKSINYLENVPVFDNMYFLFLLCFSFHFFKEKTCIDQDASDLLRVSFILQVLEW